MRSRSLHAIDGPTRYRHGTSLYRCTLSRLLPVTVRLPRWRSAQYRMGLGARCFSTAISSNERLGRGARVRNDTLYLAEIWRMTRAQKIDLVIPVYNEEA